MLHLTTECFKVFINKTRTLQYQDIRSTDSCWPTLTGFLGHGYDEQKLSLVLFLICTSLQEELQTCQYDLRDDTFFPVVLSTVVPYMKLRLSLKWRYDTEMIIAENLKSFISGEIPGLQSRQIPLTKTLYSGESL